MEAAIAIVPNIQVVAMLGMKECGLLLTKERMIFVVNYASKAFLYTSVIGAIGATLADALAKTRDLGPSPTSVDQLAADTRNITIPYDAIRRIALKRRWGGGYLRVDYVKPGGGKTTMMAAASPPPGFSEPRKAQGRTHKEIVQEYVRWVHDCFSHALPIPLMQGGTWNL
jgi:hypothetical protein